MSVLTAVPPTDALAGFPIVLVPETPGRCGGCGAIRAIFVNRWGKTQCASCDARTEGVVVTNAVRRHEG